MRKEDRMRKKIRREKAIEMFIEGKSFAEIAQNFPPWKESDAKKEIEAYLRNHPDPDAGIWRKVQTSRYHELLQVLQPGIKKKNLDAVAEARQILGRIDRIHSLDGGTSLLPPGSKLEVEIVRDRKDKPRSS